MKVSVGSSGCLSFAEALWYQTCS